MIKSFNLKHKKYLFLILISVIIILIISTTLTRVNLSKLKSEASTITSEELLEEDIESTAVLNFPKDHGQHPTFAAEWWYLNLLTKTTKADGQDENDSAYIISFSRIGGINSLLSSNFQQKTKSFKERTNKGGILTVSLNDGKHLSIKYSNENILLSLEELPPGIDKKRVYRLRGNTTEISNFDLTLKERTVVTSGYNLPLLWGGITGNCRGKISVFSKNDTFYYSIPDLDVNGTITDLNGVVYTVKVGKSWIDHQWFNSTPSNNWKGHYWASFHYTRTNNIYDPGPHQALGFVTQIYNDGPKHTYWVKRNIDGTNECGVGGKIQIINYGKTNYPASWRIELNTSNKQFIINGIPFSDNQIFKPSSGLEFFEPSSFYTANIGGKSFTGLGFFETHLKK